MEPDWTSLPDDILINIALKLESIEEVIYFSIVCHSWNCVYDMVKRYWTSRTMPWLFLPEIDEDNHNHPREIHCPSKKRTYQLKLPETDGAKCWGSSCGWIFSINNNSECHLFNPLTRDRIPLPSQSTMPHKPRFKGKRMPDFWIRNYFMMKVLTFYIDEIDDFIVIAICDVELGLLTYTRPCDQAWAPIITQIPALKKKKNIIALCQVPAIDAIRWGSQILILYHNGAIGSCDISVFQNSQPIKVAVFTPPPPSEILDSLREGPLYRLYLVESDGDLLMVLRYKQYVSDDDYPRYYETFKFEVYKLNFDTKTWETLEDLGDVALFVGINCSMSIKATCSNKCKCNCIYFTDDEDKNLTAIGDGGGHDIGCYFMENKEIEKVYEGAYTQSTFCGPFWFMPKF